MTFPNAIKTYQQTIDYFRTIAEEHVAIKHTETEKHFYEFVEQEFTGTSINDPALVLIPPRAQLVDQKSNNINKMMLHEFWLLKSIPKQNYAFRQAWMDDAEEIGLDIISRIKKEKEDMTGGAQNRLWLGFEPSSVQWEAIGPIGDLRWGYSFTFSTSNPRNLVYNSEKWSS